MTNTELNRDIKRLYNKIEFLKVHASQDKYFEFIEGEGKKEFLRLYRADDTAQALNKNSLVMMMKLNLSHRFVGLHLFYINIEL